MTLNQDQPPAPSLSLIVPRSQAKEQIEAQLTKGRKLRDSFSTSLNKDILDPDEDLKYVLELNNWRKVTYYLLARLFSTPLVADEFQDKTLEFSLHNKHTVRQFRTEAAKHVGELDSILESLDFIPDYSSSITTSIHKENKPTKQESGSSPSHKVFIVHGHDEGTREAVARVLHQLGLSPVILAEQPNQGQTIIEKFEQSSHDVSYAVVLLTPDDIGAPKNKPDDLKPRARQNVIFELGYFAAKLGRKNVCALHKGGIEIPSDYHGVVYMSMDSGDWKWRLALEIKQVLPVDLNLLGI